MTVCSFASSPLLFPSSPSYGQQISQMIFSVDAQILRIQMDETHPLLSPNLIFLIYTKPLQGEMQCEIHNVMVLVVVETQMRRGQDLKAGNDEWWEGTS